jgi:protein phosphatase
MEHPESELGGRAELERPLVVSAHGVTDRGRVRENNEDQFLILELAPDATLLCVADGMGGHAAGQEASALAVETLEERLTDAGRSGRATGEAMTGELEHALRAADARLFDEAEHHPEMEGMGTTMTVACAVRSALYVAHVGDSRLYLYRDGRLLQLTHDHTLVMEMVESGLLDPEQAARHVLRNVITNAIGGTERDLRVEQRRVALAPGDVILLCSDGLTEMVDPERIASTLAAEPDPKAACYELVNAANAAGGRDNVTVVVARFDST